MKLIKKYIIAGAIITGTFHSYAGDPARVGQAGASQLLINGWARSSGQGGANVAGITGLESMYLNVAGLAKVRQTEMIFSRTNWLRGTDININSFGFAQKLGKDNVLGLSMVSINPGEINITTVEQPDGGIGTYKPSFLNIGIGLGRNFTSSISGGALLRIISEAIPDVNAMGVCLDAGIQYATTTRPSNRLKKDDLKFGISVRNIGPDMRFSGDGLAIKANFQNATYTSTAQQRAEKFNLPSLLNIGGSYDFMLDKKSTGLYVHKLTMSVNFTNYAFSNNVTALGFEYNYNNILMLRTGYMYQDGIFKYDTRQDAHIGICGGVSVEIPFVNKKKTPTSENNSSIAVDYSFRPTNPFSGTHTFGLRLNLDSSK